MDDKETSSDLLACRACLATDVRLYDIFKHDLSEHFRKLTRYQIKQRDGYPQYLCTKCAVQLRKVAAFVDMCKRGRDILQGVVISNIPITTDFIRNMDLEGHFFMNLVEKTLYNFSKGLHPNINDDNLANIIIKDNVAMVEDTADLNVINADETANASDSNDEICEEPVIVNLNENFDEVSNSDDENDDEIMYLNNDDDDSNNEYDEASITEDSKDMVATENGFSNDDAEYLTVIVTDEQLGPELDDMNLNDKNIKQILEDFVPYNNINNSDAAAVSDFISDNDDISNETSELPYLVARKKRKRKYEKKNIFINNKEFAERNNFKLTIFNRKQQMDEIRALIESPSTKFRCDQCGVGFNYKTKFLNHFKWKHDPSLGNFVCNICNTRFSQKRYLYNHKLFVHLFKYDCKLCKFTTRARHTAENHVAYHAGKIFTCECGKTFQHNTSYLSHKRLNHSSEMTVCEYCGESFIGEWGVRMHKKKMHATEACKFKCNKCCTRFRTDAALANHHSLGCGGYNCVNCGDVFTTENLLQYHLVQNHNRRNSSGGISECASCHTKFHNDAALCRHLDDRCGEVVPCVQCGRSFTTEDEMNEHLNVHSTEQFKCEVCKKSFKSPFHFAEHYVRHSGNRDHVRVPRYEKRSKLRPRKDGTDIPKKVMCDICGQLCLSHMRVHNEQRPHQCSYCGKRFKIRGALVKHVLLIHRGIEPHQCHFCKKYFKTSASVKLHIKTVHTKSFIASPLRECSPNSVE
ncbi:zinc finger protein 431-like isoform X2 [Achroia grisella]|uniref:zinc finger protein 431-like isoform X2 n=1 Tax=Achroia grisella TaxID=688607 RepID=UPI0027D244B9|nr:zinc finger protein 431-like isoform X2 [Achroia grisella]